jgi:putative zinc finger protein
MKALTCAATRRRLQAFHDHELAVADQIAVGSHLEWCDGCAARLDELQEMRSALHALVPRTRVLTHEDAAGFTAAVVSRMKAENERSLLVRLRSAFDDLHFVYAGVGATVATVACLMIMLGMMRFATNEQRPDSLAAIVSMLATPLECAVGNDPLDASICRERWIERFQRANELAEQDAVFTLEAVLTQQGRLENLSLMRASRRHAATGQVKLIEGLLDAVTRSRLESGQTQPLPSSVNNMLWLVERQTVRASKPAPLDVPLPPKKRAASLGDPLRISRA